MNQEKERGLEQKINSPSGQFSTSESTYSKNTSKPVSNQQESSQELPLQLLQIGQLASINQLDTNNGHQSTLSNRLFTFMDERQVEKKIIQDFIYPNAFKRQSTTQGDREAKKNKPNSGITRMIEDSRQKRQDFLKRLTANTINMKQHKSTSRLNRISRSKTPKNMPFVENKYETLQPRSKSKTPKMEKCNTPSHDNDLKLFRAKSNNGKEKTKVRLQNKENIGMRESVKSRRGFQQESQALRHQKLLGEQQLLRKKKELQKQLLAVNESLLQCKQSENVKKKGKPSSQRAKLQTRVQKNKLAKH